MPWFGRHVGPGHGFNFTYLYELARTLNASDPQSPSLYHPGGDLSKLTLTYAACKNAVGIDWVPYEVHGVYDRLILWRVPLIALIATTTLPALGFWRQVFTIIHLIGDPIDTVWSLLYKLASAEKCSEWARQANKDSIFTRGPDNISEDDFLVPNPRPTFKRRQSTTLQGARDRLSKANQRRNEGDLDMAIYDLDAVALIVNSYEEWHYGSLAKAVLLANYQSRHWCHKKNFLKFRDRCTNAAEVLAADRVSTFVPAAIATIQFFVILTASFWKTLEQLGTSADEKVAASIGINQTPHNIAFGLLWFWVPVAVLATAHIGGAQTTNSVPRILNNLRHDVADLREADRRAWRMPLKRPNGGSQSNRSGERGHEAHEDVTPPSHKPDDSTYKALENRNAPSYEGTISAKADSQSQSAIAQPSREPSPDYEQSEESQVVLLPESFGSDFPPLRFGMAQRWFQGGLPTFQPDKYSDKTISGFWLYLLSLFIVAAPTAFAMFVSWKTPTEGFGCRSVTQLCFSLIWMANQGLDRILARAFQDSKKAEDRMEPAPSTWLFWASFAKDFVVTAGFVVILSFTAIGVFNNCDCWTRWMPHFERYLSFPQEQFVFDKVKSRLRFDFPIAVGLCLLLEVVTFVGVVVHFRTGHRVLKQRDLDAVLEPKAGYEILRIRFKGTVSRQTRNSNSEHRSRAIRRQNTPPRSATGSPVVEETWWHRRARSLNNIAHNVLRRRRPSDRYEQAADSEQDGLQLQMMHGALAFERVRQPSPERLDAEDAKLQYD